MMIELAGMAGAFGTTAGFGGLRRARHRREASLTRPTETAKENPAWHMLRSNEELRQAIERAITCEQASIALLERRAERFAAMRSELAPAAPPSLVRRTRPPTPPADAGQMSEAS